MSPLVRFAPSPTGYLHVGNARTALVNYLLVGARPEAFILRFDDTDRERSKDEYVQGIRRDLRWLGLSWGEEFYQSQRLDLYQAAMERLIDAGRLYPCYETAEELEYARRRLRAKGLPPIYDRGSLRLTAAERAAYETEGRRPHWRFRLEAGTVTWDDLVRGPCHYDTAHLSDPVLVRADGTFLYTLTSVVDDVDMAITHVVRGEDHVTNTAVQIQIFRALGAEPTLFAHLPLIIGADGEGLSKRLGSLSLDDLRLQGIEPMAVASLLGRLGTSDAIEAVSSLDTLAEDYDLGHFGRGTPRFDPADLTRLNQKIIHAMPWEEAAARLRALGCDHAGEPFWQAVRGNLSTMAEAVPWWTVVHGPLPPVTVPADAAPVLAAAASLLPAEPWDGHTWKAWTGAVKDATGAKGKALFLPLRLALTGHDHGPEMSALLPLIGRAQTVARLAAAGMA